MKISVSDMFVTENISLTMFVMENISLKKLATPPLHPAFFFFFFFFVRVPPQAMGYYWAVQGSWFA